MLLSLLLSALVIILDQLSKMWVVGHFAIFESQVVIPGLFNLTYLTNKGAAFGLLNGNYGAWRQIFFVVIAVIVLIGMIIAIRRLKEQDSICAVALGLIAGGAIGNLLDRLRLGSVVDFLDFYYKGHHWPAFNVADSAITVGVGLLVLHQIIAGRKQLKNTND